MRCTESSLREMLTSAYGQACGMSVVDWVREGKSVRIEREDGSITTLESVPQALEFLKGLGWTFGD